MRMWIMIVMGLVGGALQAKAPASRPLAPWQAYQEKLAAKAAHEKARIHGQGDGARFATVERDAGSVQRTQKGFDTAEGFGAYAQGGRGGHVLKVNTLDDSMRQGTLRWAVSQKYPRIIEFDVEGVIELNEDLIIEHPFITIDGSTAPGNGITLKDGTLNVSYTHDVIIRHLRVRPGDNVALKKGKWKHMHRTSTPNDAISVNNSLYVIIDHCSASWSADEALSVNASKHVSVQWCFITEPLGNPALHIENGTPTSHAFGALVSGEYISYSHNLIAYFKMRGPQLSNAEHFDTKLAAVNNLVCFYEDSGSRVKLVSTPGKFAVVGNYYRYPLKRNAPDIKLVRDQEDTAQPSFSNSVYLDDNIGVIRSSTSDDDWTGVTSDFNSRITQAVRDNELPFELTDLIVMPSNQVYAAILSDAGARLPHVDSVDARIIEQIKRGVGGIVMSQDDVGGYPRLHTLSVE